MTEKYTDYIKKKYEIGVIYCSDLWDFDTVAAKSIDSFELYFQMDLGPIGEIGADIFSIMVLSMDKDTEAYANSTKIVLPYFDSKLIESTILQMVEKCNTENEPLYALRKVFDWEFEGYEVD